MTESQAYLAFNLVDNVGPVKVAGLVERAGSVAAAWEAYPNKVARTGRPVDWEAELKLAERYAVAVVTPADREYPSALRETPGSPLALYVKGSLAALSKPMVALVGTRRATAYGRAIAHRLAYDLSKAGWGVVSGLALGIDGEAHRGALEADGVTVGVIGSGLDRFYPEENRELAREMVKRGGAVVSEFPFGRPPDQETFPIRNHVVAALARGVVAVEAPVKSGTLITTSVAADLGRTVMAVPGRIDSRMSVGCHRLIRDGAVLVRHADDILEALNDLFAASRPKPAETSSVPAPQPPDPDTPKYSVEEALVMLHVDEGGIGIDELVRLTKLPVAKVNALVLSLRVKGFIRFLPGNRISLLTARQSF